MGMMICRECGKGMSSDVDACPHCGKVWRRSHGFVFYFGWTMLLLVGSCTGLWTIGMQMKEPALSAEQAAAPQPAPSPPASTDTASAVAAIQPPSAGPTSPTPAIAVPAAKSNAEQASPSQTAPSPAASMESAGTAAAVPPASAAPDHPASSPTPPTATAQTETPHEDDALFGGAPDGDPAIVAKGIIEENFEIDCGKLKMARRGVDGTILAQCHDGERFLILKLGGQVAAMRCSSAEQFGMNCSEQQFNFMTRDECGNYVEQLTDQGFLTVEMRASPTIIVNENRWTEMTYKEKSAVPQLVQCGAVGPREVYQYRYRQQQDQQLNRRMEVGKTEDLLARLAPAPRPHGSGRLSGTLTLLVVFSFLQTSGDASQVRPLRHHPSAIKRPVNKAVGNVKNNGPELLA
jgi:hypothetical protein